MPNLPVKISSVSKLLLKRETAPLSFALAAIFEMCLRIQSSALFKVDREEHV